MRLRFAPSPTGFLHIGGARTCLFNWLYARKLNGQFILRIEDTDLERSKKEYLDEILESIKWLGMDWDEIYYQSKRFDIYQEYAKKLVDEGKAYHKEGAVFFKYDFDKIEIDDLVRGKITFNELPKDEEVIIKSDNSPTYNFCCVVDDALMSIDCIIRGEDHISNTPKQILIYQGLGFKVPSFAHVPLILSPSGGRMSKRYGATSIREYRKLGYLPEGLVNYLLLLGWSPKDDKEIISLQEAKSLFDIKNVNKTGAAFALDRLNWVNFEYIQKLDSKVLASLVENFLKEAGLFPEGASGEYIEKVAVLYQKRMNTLMDFYDKTKPFFTDDYEYEEDAMTVLEKNRSQEIKTLIDKLSGLSTFDHEGIEKEFRAVVDNLGLKVKDLIHPVRVALMGSKVGAGLFETMEVLGKEKVYKRLTKLIDYWNKNS